MKLDSTEFGRWCYDENVRINYIIPLACSMTDVGASDVLIAFLDDSTQAKLEKMFGIVFEDVYMEGDDPETATTDAQNIIDYLSEHAIGGFVIAAERCVREYRFSEPQEVSPGIKLVNYTASWGHTNPEYLYVTSMASVVSAVQKWHKGLVKREEAKFVKEQKEAQNAT